MRSLYLLILLAVFMPVITLAQSTPQVTNNLITITAQGTSGAYTGFSLLSGTEPLTTVGFSSTGFITARRVQVRDNTMTFTGLRCSATPTLGAVSFIKIKLLPDSPYPEVSFKLDIKKFDTIAWEKEQGKVPFHFLTCSVPGAQIFHQRGWAIGTPVIDNYIQMQAEGPGRQVVSNWSRDWMFAPAIGAWPTAACGLWNTTTKIFIGYDFHGARLTDHSEKRFATSYCFKQANAREFFTLVYPFAENYISLRYPKAPETCGTTFRLLWSRDIGPESDPNQFVHEFIWHTYKDLLPSTEQMNDLSWLPGNMRITDIPAPGPLQNFTYNTGADGQRWWQPNVNIATGVGYFSPVDVYYKNKDTANIDKLASECRRILPLGKWFDVEGDKCFAWQTPLDGGGMAEFGPGVETNRHVQNWYSGLALMDYYRNDPQAAADMLPFIDGILQWTKHTLYTRNCYPDVPAAQFAWSATPIVTYCLKYYYCFRDDAQRGELAKLAYKLAKSMTWRYCAIWASDNDELDDLDSSFTMEPNAGLPWLGAACANEVWVYNIAMLYDVLATGDPIMAHYLRGMLERYHVMYQNQWYPSITAYPSDTLTERFGFFDECMQGKGTRATYGGLWGEFERLIWPLGTASVRVVCGEKAAMAFNRDGRHTDIADYRYYGSGNCSFKLVPGGLQNDLAQIRDVTVTFPFFSLRDKSIWLLRNGEKINLTSERIETYLGDLTTVTLKGLQTGDTICVGGFDSAVSILTIEQIKPHKMPDDSIDFIHREGFKLLNLTRGATEGISRDWADVKSMAGYEPGIKTTFGVPFLLLDPEQTNNKVSVPWGGIAYGEKPRYLFMLVGGLNEKSRIALYRRERKRDNVDVSTAITAIHGWPLCFEWGLKLVAVRNDGQPITSISPTNCEIYAISSTDKPDVQLKLVLAAIEQEKVRVEARNAAVAQMASLKPLFEACSGRIALLPSPKITNPRGHRFVQMLTEAGLGKHVVILSKEDLVNPEVFNTSKIWAALYIGGEEYYQNIITQGDGDAALKNWLHGGGTLISLASGPFPFYYNETDKPVVNAAKFGLPISGSGAHQDDILKAAETSGWEKAPAGLELTFQINKDQSVITSLPASFPWPKEGDLRWRPMLNVIGEGNCYTPIITLKDQQGRNYGDGAALIEYRTGELSGANIVYVWSTLHSDSRYERTILRDVLRWILTDAPRPVASARSVYSTSEPVIDGKLDDEAWSFASPTDAFVHVTEGGPQPILPTTAKFLWDQQNLYLAVQAQDTDLVATHKQGEPNLWEEDAVELFLANPKDPENRYYEFIVSPRGLVTDLRHDKTVATAKVPLEAARSWKATGLLSGVSVTGTIDDRTDTDTGWSVELAIPWAALDGMSAPQTGDDWRMQVTRMDAGGKGVAADVPPSQQAWSGTNTYHNQEHFGQVRFMANPMRDDFSAYPEGTSPTPTWSISGGEWQVINGELVGRNCLTSGWTPIGACAGDGSWKDVRISTRFKMLEKGNDHRDGVWIGFKYTGINFCYSLDITPTLITLHKAFGGATTNDSSALARVSMPVGDGWHDLQIEAVGAKITVTLDNNEIINTTDENALNAAPLLAGGVCLSARRWENSTGNTVVAFDDVRIDKL